jgi:hypothetical protein
MKRIKTIFLSIVGASVILSCNKQIVEKQSDPNNATVVPSQLILGTVLTAMSGTTSEGSTGIGALGGINSWDDVHDWNQYHCQNYDYYGNNIYSWTNNSTETDNASNTSDGPFNSYLVIKNVVQMENEAANIGDGSVNPYEAIGRFVKAYYFYNMTMLMGDVPLGDALKGTSNPTPAYAPQESVFLYVLQQLDTANADFANLIANNNTLLTAFASQDIYYGADLTKWQKLVNSFELRVLVELSNKSGDQTLNIPARFASILNTPGTYPIFASEADDFAFSYNPGSSNTFSVYPFNPSNFGSIAGRYNMADTYVKALTTISDPRVFITCDPAWGLPNIDTANPAQYQFFVGASSGLDLGTMYGNASAGLYSYIGRKRYYSNFTGYPNVLVGYKEMLFNIAEGIERGWGGSGAETYYKNGITASMAFYGLDVTQTNFTAYFLPPGGNAVSQVAPYPFTFDWTTYYSNPAVQLSGTPATAINQIVLQKYIAMFETSGYEPYYNWRRTGIPAFESGSGVGNGGTIPVRWAYPVTEQAQNSVNWSAALKNQGFSADDLNQKMWILQ